MTIENETINFFFEGEVDNADYVLMSRVDIKKERGAETSELDQSETESKKRMKRLDHVNILKKKRLDHMEGNATMSDAEEKVNDSLIKESVAGPENKYMCQVPGCDASFKWLSRLTWHVTKHNEARIDDKKGNVLMSKADIKHEIKSESFDADNWETESDKRIDQLDQEEDIVRPSDDEVDTEEDTEDEVNDSPVEEIKRVDDEEIDDPTFQIKIKKERENETSETDQSGIQSIKRMKRLDRAYILRRKSLNHEQVNATKSSAEDEQKEAHSYQSTRKSKRRNSKKKLNHKEATATTSSAVGEQEDEADDSQTEESEPECKKKYKCTEPGCEARFLRPSRLTWHLRKHKDERPFKCDLEGCLRAYTNSSHLKRHQNTTHMPVSKTYECQQCKMELGSLFSLKRHYKKIHDPSRLTCTECGAKFRKKHTYHEHLAMHNGDAMYICDVCGTQFMQLRMLKKHKIIHEPKKTYPCTSEGCVEIFDKWSTMREHIKVQHALGEQKMPQSVEGWFRSGLWSRSTLNDSIE